MENLKKKNKKDKGGRPQKYGGFSFLAKVKKPQDKKRIIKYLSMVRGGLVQDLGPMEDDLTTAQIVLIDRVIMKLGCVRSIEEYIKETTVMKGDDLAPSLKASYLAYNNSIRLDLRELGIHTKKSDEGEDLQKYIDRKYGGKEAEAKQETSVKMHKSDSGHTLPKGGSKPSDKASPVKPETPEEKEEK